MEPQPVPPAPDPVQALFDTHVHLLDGQFDADREAVLAALPAAGVTRALEAGNVPWAAVWPDNEASLALEHAMGFEVAPADGLWYVS